MLKEKINDFLAYLETVKQLSKNTTNSYRRDLDKFSDSQGRKELVEKLRKEMRKGLEKEYMLNTEDRVLLYNFFNKLRTEINSVEEN